MFQPKITEINRNFNWQFSILWLVHWPTFFSEIFKIFLDFSFETNRISTEFFSEYKKISKIIFKIFFEFFFSKNFFYENLFLPIFFWWKFCLSNFFWRKFFFSQKYFFCIWCLRDNVFCEIFYLKFCLLRIFCFAILVYGNTKYQIWKCFFSEKK